MYSLWLCLAAVAARTRGALIVLFLDCATTVSPSRWVCRDCLISRSLGRVAFGMGTRAVLELAHLTGESRSQRPHTAQIYSCPTLIRVIRSVYFTVHVMAKLGNGGTKSIRDAVSECLGSVIWTAAQAACTV